MTALDVYDMVTSGGGTDFGRLVRICEDLGRYCLIGGMAVNCYVEPVYTVDVNLVVASTMDAVPARLTEAGFAIEHFPHSVNAVTPGSDLRVQFTTDPRYQNFPERASLLRVLEWDVQVASLEDVTQGKIWAWSDASRRFSKRKKDELDLIRLAEAYPHLLSQYPPALRHMIEKG